MKPIEPTRAELPPAMFRAVGSIADLLESRSMVCVNFAGPERVRASILTLDGDNRTEAAIEIIPGRGRDRDRVERAEQLTKKYLSDMAALMEVK